MTLLYFNASLKYWAPSYPTALFQSFSVSSVYNEYLNNAYQNQSII